MALLRLAGVIKRYGGVAALSDVDLAVEPGEVVGLIGENGAGKSTLIKIVAGAVRPDAGEMRVDDRPVAFRTPRDAIAAELAVERVVIAREADERGRELRRVLDQTLGDIPITVVSHEELKRACASAVAVVRTGECTPYFNAILVAGVSF